ncbi:MAG: YjbH domain-containing protein [Alphaproteobacteria bacterium]|nr:YjbH domain-containing protein [Alphaproteobacteria bacterium]MBU1281665.1 YjbH domain-containing protein [Alphaproteobacteria bacterium]MBU1571938.1 YjbH domain-containing protein [Alphaproteobacteria bacterium]MBU1830411.1 YjbH domain-containing protein [Alphaproteobacteria bacterium]MBU2077185.1 YjbH domain-containing protein [Alphaproteobacteria bacterium]
MRQVVIASLLLSASGAEAADLKFPISTYGTPGLIDMPTGEVFPDGQLSATTSYFNDAQKYTLSFQISPRMFGSFRYSILDKFDAGSRNRYDRSFDFGYLLMEESNLRPSVVVGLRDFGGTGLYGSEYVAATKHFMDDRLALTGGIGWGRLGSYGGFTNPLSILSDAFETRGDGPTNISEVGRLETDQWFRGDAALFGGVAYQVNDRLTLKAEYSSDAYEAESDRIGFDHKTPFNAAISYGFKNGAEVSVYALHGSEIGIMGSIPITPQKPKYPSGIEEAPPTLMPRQTQAALSWDANSVRQKDSSLSMALKDQGITLEGITIEGDTATVRFVNGRYPAEAQALGRAARVLANQLPADITTFRLEAMANGVTTSRTTLRRSDLESLEYDLDGSWRSFARADFEDAAHSEAAPIAGIYPKFNWRITPYLDPSLFDPDNPVRADFGVQAAASLEPARGLVFSAAVRQPVAGNLDTSTRPSNSVLPHVRTDSAEYAKQSDLEIKYLTAEYFFRPGKNLYGRATVGYLETMYGGVSGEVLWKPVNGPLALGAELNYVKKRDFDQMFGFQDYDIVTGHASAYYDFGGGYLGQLDVGRYLAGDYGATFSVDREFDNGFRVGAFFTLTDVSFDDFGEGSFDKGIRFSVPVDWLTGAATQGGYGTTIRPVVRDGGARLDVRNRLYDVVRNSHTSELEDRWGKFWR